MPDPILVATARRPHSDAEDRASRILAAAERCFARAGFHRATMADVATEAGMSAGNLYRYFRSKDEIVAGLASRDMAELADDFAALAHAPDIFAAFKAMGRKHLIEAPREKAALQLEIWAEAARNARIAAICSACEARVEAGLVAVFEAARLRGLVAPQVDARQVARLLSLIADGLFRRRALSPDFDGAAEMALTLAVIETALRGHIPAVSHSAAQIEAA